MQRINFIEREPFGLNYRKMLVIGGGLFGLLAIMTGAQWGRGALLSHQWVRLEGEVKTLKEEQERIFKATVGGVKADARETLIDLIDSAPPWSMILRELATRTPRSVWLTKLKSVLRTEPSAPQALELSGYADDAGRVAQFVKGLQKAPLFSEVVLASSKREKGTTGSAAYNFVVTLFVQSAKGKGL